MEIRKTLIVNALQKSRSSNVPYKIELIGDNNTNSKIYFDKPSLRKNMLLLEDIFPEKRLEIILNSGRVKRSGTDILGNLDKNSLEINSLLMSKKQTRHYMHLPTPSKHDSLVYLGLFKSFKGDNGIHLHIIECPLYDISLDLTEDEYNRLIKLPGPAIMRVGFKAIDE